MSRRHPKRPIPQVWLMTDERMGQALWAAIARLPQGAGIVFRHHATALQERRRLFARVVRVARRRGAIVVRAGPERLGFGEAGVHGLVRRDGNGLRTWPAHSRIEAVAARRAGAELLFVSPVFPTRSHPGGPAIGALRAAAIGRGLGLPVIALGGMDAARYLAIRRSGFHGWAAIDAWTRQKRKAVPI